MADRKPEMWFQVSVAKPTQSMAHSAQGDTWTSFFPGAGKLWVGSGHNKDCEHGTYWVLLICCWTRQTFGSLLTYHCSVQGERHSWGYSWGSSLTHVQAVQNGRYLGVWLDQKLAFKFQFNTLVCKLRQKMSIYRDKAIFPLAGGKQIIRPISFTSSGDADFTLLPHQCK